MNAALRGLLTGLAMLAPALAGAQAFPDHPIRLVVPYAPGGSADIAARLIAEDWAHALGTTMIIDNRAGAGGNIGIDTVAKSSGDGYTIGLQTVSLAINPSIFPKMPYDTLKDLTPIGMVASSQHVLVVTDAFPAKDLPSMLAELKSKPGKYTFGSAGAGSTLHMAAELFRSVSGTNIVHVPYRGGGPALMDTIGGQVDMSFPVVSAAQQQIAAGKVRAIGVTGPTRSALIPQVPTIAEAGLPSYRFETWFIVIAPSSTPKAIVDKLNATLNQAMATAPLKDRMTKEGYEPTPSTPAQARAKLESELVLWGKLVKERGITAE